MNNGLVLTRQSFTGIYTVMFQKTKFMRKEVALPNNS